MEEDIQQPTEAQLRVLSSNLLNVFNHAQESCSGDLVLQIAETNEKIYLHQDIVTERLEYFKTHSSFEFSSSSSNSNSSSGGGSGSGSGSRNNYSYSSADEEKNKDKKTIQIFDFTYEAVKRVMVFAYSSQIHGIDTSNCMETALAASFFGANDIISYITEMCAESVSDSQILPVYASILPFEPLRVIAHRLVRRVLVNFTSWLIGKRETILELSPLVMASIMESADFQFFPSEDKLFDLLLEWRAYQESKHPELATGSGDETLVAAMNRVFELVNYPLMSESYLENTVKPCEFVCRDYLDEARAYRKDPKLFLKAPTPRTSKYFIFQRNGNYYLKLFFPNFSTYIIPARKPWGHADRDVKTVYKAVQVDPLTLLVNTGNTTYASSTGHCSHHAGTGYENRIPFASAFDCESPESTRGIGLVDLRCTGYMVDDSFKHGGWMSAGSWEFSHDNQVVQLRGGGYCGWVAPSKHKTEDEAVCGGYFLQLKKLSIEEAFKPEFLFELPKDAFTQFSSV